MVEAKERCRDRNNSDVDDVDDDDDSMDNNNIGNCVQYVVTVCGEKGFGWWPSPATPVGVEKAGFWISFFENTHYSSQSLSLGTR
jgi:hypothetical protein